jgi:hypothetical protein
MGASSFGDNGFSGPISAKEIYITSYDSRLGEGMANSTKLLIAVLVVIVVGISLLSLIPKTLNSPAKEMTSTVTVSSDGIGPSTLSLTWTKSGDWLFNSYTLRYSTEGSNGPWTSLSPITEKSTTSQYINDLIPGQTYWWQVIDTDSLGTATSNTYQITQPDVATLSYTRPTDTSVQFSWNNQATYGGKVIFSSYELMESINNGAYGLVQSITSKTTTSYLLQGLSSDNSYSFYLVTTDATTGGSSPDSTDSNIVSFDTNTSGGGVDSSILLLIGIIAVVAVVVVLAAMRRR